MGFRIHVIETYLDIGENSRRRKVSFAPLKQAVKEFSALP
jgi:hypothetical protein